MKLLRYYRLSNNKLCRDKKEKTDDILDKLNSINYLLEEK